MAVEPENSEKTENNLDNNKIKIEKEEPIEIKDKEEVEIETKEPTALEKYWKAVRENPSDFTGWTYLLQYVEQEDDVPAARTAFDAFFKRYPYCYGYWKKYGDMEKKHKNLDAAEEVFKRGLQAIPLSVDLWTHYIAFMTAKHAGDADLESVIRQCYEKAVAAAGIDFRTDKLWDAYISWEKEQKNMKQVTGLYDRLLAIPTQLYSHNFDNFKTHVQDNLPKDVLSLDEFLKLRQDIVANKPIVLDDDDEVVPGLEAEGPPGVEGPPGEDVPPGMEVGTPMTDDTETKALREKIIELRSAVYTQTEEEVSKRWSYEEGVRRPYFHVKPLERSQLKNWRDYLDFEMDNGSHERVVVLFERCMIACALYEDFWLKYAKYMEQHSVESARHVFKRACNTHLPKKPIIHLAWAAFEERQGVHQGAYDVLKNLDETLPGLLMVSMRRISLERRHGNHKLAEALFQEYIKNTTSAEIKNFYALKYARYQAKVLGNIEQAKTILKEAIEREKKNMKLYLQLIDLEFQHNLINEDRMIQLFEWTLGSPLPPEEKIVFSRRRMEFMEDFGSDVNKFFEVYEDHQKLLKEVNTNKKRKAQEELSTEDASGEKKTKMEPAANGDTTAVPAAPVQDPSSYYNNHWHSYSNYNYNPHNPNTWGAYNAATHYYPSQ